MRIVTRFPRTPNPQKIGLAKDVIMKLSQLNSVVDDDNNDGRLALPGEAVEFGWFSIKLVSSKML